MTCAIPGCERTRRKRDWCQTHYGRWLRHGDPNIVLQQRGRRCSIDGCDERHFGRGWCQNHYTRWRRHGDPTGGGLPHGTLLAWLKDAVQRDTDECIRWPFKSRTTGYGAVWFEGERRLAHHVALILVGRATPQPPHEQTRHLCGERRCVNPRHLLIGTQSENEADKVRHGRSNRGHQRSGMARLTPEQVRAIRRSRALHTDLAAEYGVSHQTISDIKRRKTWAWLADEPEGAAA